MGDNTGNNNEIVVDEATGYPCFLICLKRKPERIENARKEFEKAGIKNHIEFEGTDGWFTTEEEFKKIGIGKELCKRKGLAGCASSHIRVWREIVQKKIPWSIIFEDDIHFHPNFLTLCNAYTKNIPSNVDIFYLGYCCPNIQSSTTYAHRGTAMCLHAYMLSYQGAVNLLKYTLPMNQPVDIAMILYYKKCPNKSSFVNTRTKIGNIIPVRYKNQNGERYKFHGIVFQNHEDCGSTIHASHTTYPRDRRINQQNKNNNKQKNQKV